MSPAQKHKLYGPYVDYFQHLINQDVVGIHCVRDSENPEGREYVSRDECCDILAQCCVILSDKKFFKQTLQRLEADLHQHLKDQNITLKLPIVDQWKTVWGQDWPLPTEALLEQARHQKTYSALSKVLLKKEQAYGMNLNAPEEREAVAKFLGFIAPDLANEHLANYNNWREDNRLSNLFLHDKDLHRIQKTLFMYALELGLMEILGTKPLRKIFDLLRFNQTATGKPLWDVVLDYLYNYSNENIQKPDYKNWFHPVLQGVQNMSDVLQETSEMTIGMDPFYVHRFLLAADQEFPTLAAYSRIHYAKTFEKINRLQNTLGVTRRYISNPDTILHIEQPTISLEETFEELENFYNIVNMKGSINPLMVITDYYNRGLADQADYEKIHAVSEEQLAPIWGDQGLAAVGAFRDTPGIIFFKKKKPGTLPDVQRDLRSCCYTKIELRGLKASTIGFLHNYHVVTTEELKTLSLADIYKKLRDTAKDKLPKIPENEWDLIALISITDEDADKMRPCDITDILNTFCETLEARYLPYLMNVEMDQPTPMT